MKITKIVIDENRWLRAGWNGGLITDYKNMPEYREDWPKDKTDQSSLFNEQTQRMCCLGFASCAAGLKKKEIQNAVAPSSLDKEAKKKIIKHLPWLLDAGGSDSKAGQELMGINDNDKITLPKKRARIKEIFAEHGIDVIFTR